MFSLSASLEGVLLALDGMEPPPSLSKAKGSATITAGDCLAELVPMDGRLVLTSVMVPSASEPSMPLLLLLAAEYAAGTGRELFLPRGDGCDLSGYDACSLRDGVCAGRLGTFVVYMGPRLMRRKRRSGGGAGL
jgi:hypothetical protein